MTKPEIKCRTIPELKEELAALGEKPFRAQQIFRWMHTGVSDFDEMTNLSKPLRTKLRETAIIDGVPELRGADVVAPDLRAGAALVIAGLAAYGRTTISQIGLIERGYENLIQKVTAIGGDIRLEEFVD